MTMNANQVRELPRSSEERCRDLNSDQTFARIKRYITSPPENSRVFTITPEVARAILEDYNDGNRTHKPRALTRYAEDMRVGRWYLTGDTIKFSDRGLLRDGQHRLKACVVSGVALLTHVVFGIDDRTFAYLDRGRNRDVNDVLMIAGKQNTRRLAAAARWWHLIENNRVKMRDTIEPHEALEIANRHPQLERFVVAAQKVEKQYGEPCGPIAALMYAWHRANPRLAKEAMDALSIGAIPKKFEAFRKALGAIQKKKAENDGRIHDVVRAALWVKAWNLVAENRVGTARDFKFDLSSEDFPQIAG